MEANFEFECTALAPRRKELGQRVVSFLLEKKKKFLQHERPDGEDADLIYGSDKAFERAWTDSSRTNIELQLKGKPAEGRSITKFRNLSGAIGFWRLCGFRRIGASCCFALSFDLQHQSRAFAEACEFDPRRSNAEDLEDEKLETIYNTDPWTNVKKLKTERLRDVLPLHHASLTLTDEELKDFFHHSSDDKIGWVKVTKDT
jgi:hypothetical protein